MTTNRTKSGRACLLAAALLMAGMASPPAPAGAQPTYDRRIEEAAIQALQPKLGDIRGSLDLDTEAHIHPPLTERAEIRDAAGLSRGSKTGHVDGSLIRY